MADQDENASGAIVKAGNSFLLRFLAAFVLITFFIVPRPPEAQRKVNENVGEGQKLIDVQRDDIHNRLKQANRDLRNFDRNLFNTFSAGRRSAVTTSQDSVVKFNQLKERLLRQREELVKARRELREKLIKLNQDFVTLEKARVFRQVALPGTSFSLMEADVRVLYPGALAVAMLMLLSYRRRLLKSLGSETPATLPLWAAPVPLRAFGRSFRSTLFLNIAGLTFIGILLSLYVNFILRDEFYPDLRAATLQLLLGGAVTCLYGIESIRAIGKSFANAKGLEEAK